MKINGIAGSDLAAGRTGAVESGGGDFSRHMAEAKEKAAAPAAVSAGKPDLRNLTADEARQVIADWERTGTISADEGANLGSALLVRWINQCNGHAVPERFDLIAETGKLIENSKYIGRFDQARALAHTLDVMKAYQQRG
ncbi:hypothetical protein ACEU07_12960 [Chromobacterium violaceum]|uniref:hypothetical protein n=1 Tax=Chromobacterium violaceum TaxID=536 RepID=UPI0035A60860